MTGTVYLIGETHIAEEHAEYEVETIRDVAPAYVLLEGMGGQNQERIERNIEGIARTYTLEAIRSYVAENFPEDPQVVEEDDEYQARDPSVPLVKQDVMDLIDLQGAVGMQRVTEENEYRRWMDEERWADTDERAVMYGADEDAAGDRKLQVLKRIENNIEQYMNEKMRESNASVMRIAKVVDDLRADGKDIEVRGCDLDKKAYIEEHGMPDDMATFNAEREETMVDTIAAAADEDDGPVVAVIGGNHFDPVREQLQERGYTVKGEKLEEAGGAANERLDSLVSGQIYSEETLKRLEDD